MATNLEDREQLPRSAETHSIVAETNLPEASKDDAESAGYIVYLTGHELPEAYVRARRKNPDAEVHFEGRGDDLWSLEVYKSKAARRAYLRHAYYRDKALGYLDLILPGKRPPVV